MKKKLIITIVGAAVTVVAIVGALAGIAAAQSNDEDSDKESFVDRVASILGISSDEVQDAFEQAREEMLQEKKDAHIARLIEAGKITQEEADAIEAWINSKPEIEINTESMSGFKRFEHGGFGKGLTVSEERLAYMVEKGIISQEDADALSEWYDSRPDALDNIMSSDKDCDGRGGKGRGYGGKHGRGWGAHHKFYKGNGFWDKTRGEAVELEPDA